jgi:hypothetical protein
MDEQFIIYDLTIQNAITETSIYIDGSFDGGLTGPTGEIGPILEQQV